MLGEAGGAAIDHGLEIGVVDRGHQLGRLGDGVHQCGFLARQRLDAIDDAFAACGLRHLRQGVAQPGQRDRVGLSRRDLPLFGRAVHQNGAAEFGAKAGEAEHHGKRAGAHRGVGVGQRQAFGFDQQPVQAGDGEARGLDRGADFPASAAEICSGRS